VVKQFLMFGNLLLKVPKRKVADVHQPVHAFQLQVVNRWGIDGWDFLVNHPIGLLSLTSAGCAL
jgi:hypothetical protein